MLQKGKGQSKDLYNVRNDDQIDEVNIDIPIIYGEVTTTGQKADGGSKRSSLDPKRTLRQYTLIMSEGKTEGIVGELVTLNCKIASSTAQAFWMNH